MHRGVVVAAAQAFPPFFEYGWVVEVKGGTFIGCDGFPCVVAFEEEQRTKGRESVEV